MAINKGKTIQPVISGAGKTDPQPTMSLDEQDFMARHEHLDPHRSHSTPAGHLHNLQFDKSRKISGVIEHPSESENRWVRTQEYHVVYMRDRHGPFRRAVPHMTVGMATFCCCLNVVLPGVGTFLSGITIVCCEAETEYEPHIMGAFVNFLAGILQLVLTPLIVGWVWSIWWGVIMINIARKWWVPRLADRDSTFDKVPVRL